MNRFILSILLFTLLFIACGISKTSEPNATNGSSINVLNAAKQLVNKDTMLIYENSINEEELAVKIVFLHQGKEYILHDTLDVLPDYPISIDGSVEDERYELYYYGSLINAAYSQTYIFGVYDGEMMLEKISYFAEDRYMNSFKVMRPFMHISEISEQKLIDLHEQFIGFELPRSQRTGHIDLAPAAAIFRTVYEQEDANKFQLLVEEESLRALKSLTILSSNFKEGEKYEIYLSNIEHYNNIAFYLEQMGAEKEALAIQKEIDEVFPERKWGLLEKLNNKTGTLQRYKINEAIQFYLQKDGELMFLANDKEVLTRNKTVIRTFLDENHDCFYVSMPRVIREELFFTIEQQNCEGNFIINEFITFQMDSTSNNAYLHKFEIEQIDKSNSDNKLPLKTLTEKDFGKIAFAKVNIEKLYALLNR